MMEKIIIDCTVKDFKEYLDMYPRNNDNKSYRIALPKDSYKRGSLS